MRTASDEKEKLARQMGRNKQICQWKWHLVVLKPESAVARRADLYGKWPEWRLGQVSEDADSPVEEMATSEERGTVTVLGSRGRARKRDCGHEDIGERC